MKMVPSIFSAPLLPLLLLCALSSKAYANELANDGFIAEIVGSTKAISGTFMPNPRNDFKPMMILNAKKGQVHVLENPDESDEDVKILDIESELCTNGERGLHTIIPSPNFAENLHLFAFYTTYKEDCLEDPLEGPHNVVMRFTMDPETLQLNFAEGTLIFRGPPMDERLHNGGAMAFGNDGMLYITTGDAGIRDNAGTFDDVHGSIIRLNEDGTVPDDNPYTKASGYPNSYRCADTEGRVPEDAPEDSYCAEVWANGLRNPFRMDMDYSVTDKVHFTFGVVGAQHIEAIYNGGTDYKATNYGWPKYEGVCRPGHIDECEPNTDPGVTMPFHWYEHISYTDGGCIGGQVHVPQGVWPPEFKYLFIDFILLKIYNLELDHPELACEECSPPLPPTKNETFYTSIQEEDKNVNEARMVDMWFGPYKDTQALYVTKFGNRDTIHRIRYNGILNKPPKPDFEFTLDGAMAVTFDAGLTTDPEGDDLKYEWDFGDESEFLVDQTIVSHQYTKPGEYIVTLKVTDTSGQEQEVSDIVRVGSPPKVTIISPAEGTSFAVGKILRLKGEAVDYMGNPIPDERLTWEVRQHHADHFHPFLDPSTNMNDFDLWPAPDPEDYLAATNSFLKVLLTAEDEYGVSETVFVDVLPKIVMVNVTTHPPGLEVVVDGFGIEAPQIITSWKGFMLPVTVEDQGPYIFKQWSDGRKTRSRKFNIFNRANGALPQVQAEFCSALATNCENHDECCSGYCSPGMSGICAIMPPSPTVSPASANAPYALVPDPHPSELQIDVISPPQSTNEGRPLDLYTDDTTSNNISVSASLSDDERSTGVKDIILEYSPFVVIVFALVLLVYFVANCKVCEKRKKYKDPLQHVPYVDDESESDLEGGNQEYYYDVKAAKTGSTEESGDNINIISSPAPDDNFCNNSNISLSFLVPDSMPSEAGDVDDIENQDGAAPGSPGINPLTSTYLMQPLTPSPSLTHPKVQGFEDAEEEPEVEGILEYRFDVASTSQSSLIPPPQSALAQESFDGAFADQSVALSIPSPQKSVIEAIPERNTLSNANSESESDDSSVDRDLGETSEVIDTLVLSYFSEKAVNETVVAKEDKSASILPPIVDTNDSLSEDEEMDEDERVLDLLLSATIDERSLHELTMSFARKDIESTEEADATELHSVDPTKLTEESSILSDLCVASTEEEAEYPAEDSEFLIETISHENKENDRVVELSPLKSPALESKRRSSATKTIHFMSPEASQLQKETEETPETAMCDSDSSVGTNEFEINEQSKIAGMNLQSTFADSAIEDEVQASEVSVSRQLNEEEVRNQ